MTKGEADRVAKFIKTLVITPGPPVTPKPQYRGQDTRPPTGERWKPRGGVTIPPGTFRGGAKTGTRVGSGGGFVNVGFRLLGGPKKEKVVLPPGFVMTAKDASFQNGLLVQEVTLVVLPEAEQPWLLRMYCANGSRKRADATTEFTTGPVLDSPPFQELFGLLAGKSIPKEMTGTVQDAVWEITDGDGRLKRGTRAALAAL